MADKFRANIPSHRITAPEAFFDRRRFLSKLGGLGLGLLATPALFRASETAVAAQSGMLQPPLERPDVFPATRNQAYTIPSAIERRDLMAREIAASHNNFYEFLPGKGGPAWRYAGDFEVEPWQVQITGECEKPTILDLDDLFAFEHEERGVPFSLCGKVGDERALERLPAQPPARDGRAAELGPIRSLHQFVSRRPDARRQGVAMVSVALPRSAADG